MDKKSKPFSDLADRIRFFEEIGAGFVFKSEAPRRAARPEGPRMADVRSDYGTNVPGSGPSGPAGESGLDLPRSARTLEDIAAEVRTCRKCGLAAGRTLAVPGEGNPKSPLLFVGEGPGHDEDVQGRPFVGRAGQLLTKIIQAMGYDRSEVFIANVVKCRPPENRVPHREEAETCAPFLLEQISVLRPRVIVTLGKTAVDFFLPDVKAMGMIRGNFQEWHGLPIMPTFHPSYLIRNEGNKEIKRMVWNDMQKVMAFLRGD
ncbi:MAG: uracil-DNA glycosylase [Candidatus Aminicenantes bacterium]|nr:uracil-DNA glycosylase [Candidatus Aminicenantes bacterium]